MMTKITLEDKGQDLLWLRVNEGGLVEEAGPFQNEFWKGAFVPVWSARVGQLCPIHRKYPLRRILINRFQASTFVLIPEE